MNPGSVSMEEVSNLPISLINRSWTDEQRRIVWCLICKSRTRLQVQLSPIIASAFVILQHYFRSSEQCAYELFILMVAALFTACKGADCYRPIQLVYQELQRICQTAPSLKIRSLLGRRDGSGGPAILDPEDLASIASAEIDLLRSIDFNLDFDLPFTHFDRLKQTLMTEIPNEAFIHLCNSIIVDICLMICSSCYLDVPPEVAAAAATAESVNTDVIPRETFEWLMNVREKYGAQVFDLARLSISQEKEKTAPRRDSPAMSR
jgi:hypothetical protein